MKRFHKLLALMTMLSWLGTQPTFAVETWQSCLETGQKALQTGDTQFGYFKLRQAWLSIGDPDFSNPAYLQLYRAFNGPVATAGAAELKEFSATRLKLKTTRNRWQAWTITKLPNGSLSLTAPRSAFSMANETRCWNGMTDEETKANVTRQDYLDRLYSTLPILITPKSEKYPDLLAQCGSLEINKPTPVECNLSPFTSPEIGKEFGPIAVFQHGALTFDYNDLLYRGGRVPK